MRKKRICKTIDQRKLIELCTCVWVWVCVCVCVCVRVCVRVCVTETKTCVHICVLNSIYDKLIPVSRSYSSLSINHTTSVVFLRVYNEIKMVQTASTYIHVKTQKFHYKTLYAVASSPARWMYCPRSSGNTANLLSNVVKITKPLHNGP